MQADAIEARTREEAAFVLEQHATVRAAAEHFGISKSTVHKDLTFRLPTLDRALSAQVRQLLDQNKAERHLRGGLATKRKYESRLSAGIASLADHSDAG